MGAAVASNVTQAALVKLSARENGDADLLRSLVSEVSKLQRSLGCVSTQSPTRTAIVGLVDSSWEDRKPQTNRKSPTRTAIVDLVDSCRTDPKPQTTTLLASDSEKSTSMSPVAYFDVDDEETPDASGNEVSEGLQAIHRRSDG